MSDIDYSEEDLQQLLSVSSLAEYVVQMVNLHGTFRINVEEFKDGVKCTKCKSFAGEITEEIDKHLALLKGYLERLPEDANKTFILPQLFSKVASLDEPRELFIKNVSCYHKALEMIHESSTQINHGDSDLARLVETYCGITKELSLGTRERVYCDASKEERVDETPAEPPKMESQKPDVSTEKKEPEISHTSIVDAETEDNLVVISGLCKNMESSSSRFVDTYKAVDSQKVKVISCLNQLKTFEEQGLDVCSAIMPLTAQLSQLVNLQKKHIEKFNAQNAALAACVDAFDDEVKNASKKK